MRAVIFSSKKGLAEAAEFDYYESDSFTVDVGNPVHVQLMMANHLVADLQMVFRRLPDAVLLSNSPEDYTGVYQLLRCHRADQQMGDPQVADSLYDKNIVYLGKSPSSQFFDWVTIDRPGVYRMYGTKKRNGAVAESANTDCPLIVSIATQFSIPAQDSGLDFTKKST